MERKRAINFFMLMIYSLVLAFSSPSLPFTLRALWFLILILSRRFPHGFLRRLAGQRQNCRLCLVSVPPSQTCSGRNTSTTSHPIPFHFTTPACLSTSSYPPSPRTEGIE